MEKSPKTKSRKERSKKEHKKEKRDHKSKKHHHKEEEMHRNIPEEQAPPLDDIIQTELSHRPVTVSKGPVGVKPVSDQEVVGEDFEKVGGEIETTVLASEVHEALQNTKESISNGRGGDYSAAYHELYAQLCVRMVDIVYNYFQKQYRVAKSDKNTFRGMLEDVENWNQKMIQKRAKSIVSKYKDTEYYFRFAYAANLMLMSVVVQKDENSEDVEIEVPKFSDFVHRVYIETARFLYAVPGVLDSKLDDHKRLRIREDLFICIGKAISTSLRMMVPLQVLMKNHERPLENFDGVESDEEDDFSEDEEDDEEQNDDQSVDDESGSETGSETGDSEQSSQEQEDSESDESGSISSGSTGSYSEDFDSEEESSEEELPPPPPPQSKHRRRDHSKYSKDSKQPSTKKRTVGISKRALETPDNFTD